MKRICVILCMCMCLGCSRQGSMAQDNLNLERAFESIQEEIEDNAWHIGELNNIALSEEEILEAYGLTKGVVEEAMVRQAIIPASCGEIAIFHMLEEADASTIEAAVQHRLDTLSQTMELLPVQRKCLAQAQVEQIGRYYIFVLGVDAQNVIQYISSL